MIARACRRGARGRAGIAVGMVLSALALAVQAAGDPARGRDKARACSVCHGQDGIAVRPDAPNIAGQSEFYLREQLRAYRSGQRRHPQMDVIAQGLSDQDIDDLGSWFSSIRITVEVPAP